MGCFKSNALALRHSHRSPRNESDSGRLFGSLAAFKFAIGASFKTLQSDSFQNDFAPHSILLFQKMRGWLRWAPPKYVVRHSFWEWEQRAPVAESSYLSSSDSRSCRGSSQDLGRTEIGRA